MANEIERLNRMRRNILVFVLLGTLAALYLLTRPFFGDYSRGVYNMGYLEIAFIVWSSTLVLFGVFFWLYKRRLRRDPSLREAVDDERVKVNWLRAYRFAFCLTMIMTVIYIWPRHLQPPRYILRPILPNGPFFILYVAVICLLGSFLFFNQKADNE